LDTVDKVLLNWRQEM